MIRLEAALKSARRILTALEKPTDGELVPLVASIIVACVESDETEQMIESKRSLSVLIGGKEAWDE